MQGAHNRNIKAKEIVGRSGERREFLFCLWVYLNELKSLLVTEVRAARGCISILYYKKIMPIEGELRGNSR